MAACSCSEEDSKKRAAETTKDAREVGRGNEDREMALLGALRLEAARFQRIVGDAVEVALQEHLQRQEQLLAGQFPFLREGSSPAKAAPDLFIDLPLAESTSPLEISPASGADVPNSEQRLSVPPKAESEGVRRRRRSRERLHEVHAAHGSNIHAFLLKHCRSWLMWWWGLKEPERTGRLARVLSSQMFSTLLATVICANTFVSAAVINCDILGERVPKSLRVWEWTFVFFFAAEVVLKLWVHRLYFFVGSEVGWNVFDLILAVLSIFQFVLVRIMLAQRGAGDQVTVLRAIRVLRLTRVLRGFKVFSIFSELRLLLKCVIGSLASMFWSCIMLAFTIFLFSLIILETMREGRRGLDPRAQELIDNFGSVQQTMLSLYISVTGGQDWSFYFDLLPGAKPKVVFVLFIFFFNITVLNILTGLYVDSAMKHAIPGRKARAKELLVQQLADHQELHQFCVQRRIVSDGSVISRAAFRAACADEHFAAYLSTFGISSSNPDEMFRCLQDLGAPLTLDGLVKGLLQLREPATNYDVERVALRTRAILSKIPAGDFTRVRL